MRYVSATETKQRLGAVLDAVQRGPVTIRRQKRDVAVMLSAEQYRQLRDANTDEFQRFCDRIGKRAATRGLSENELSSMLKPARRHV